MLHMHAAQVLRLGFEQECIPVGCVLPTLYHIGGLPDRDPPRQTEIPPVNRITDRCKNITFPQLHLQLVKSRDNYEGF